jgi:hypothetical protein
MQKTEVKRFWSPVFQKWSLTDFEKQILTDYGNSERRFGFRAQNTIKMVKISSVTNISLQFVGL